MSPYLRVAARTLTVAASGVLAGVILAAIVAAFEYGSFIPVMAVVVVFTTVAMIISAGVLACFRSRRRAAKFILIAALTLCASFYAAMTFVRS